MTLIIDDDTAASKLREQARHTLFPRWSQDDCTADELLYLQRRLRGVLDEVRTSTVADTVRTTDCIDLLDDALSQMTALACEAADKANEPRQYEEAAGVLADMAAYRARAL